MTNRASGALAVAIALSAAGSASALAAPLKGETYQGGVPTTGVTQEGHHRVVLRAGGKILLHVSGSGKSVSVRFSSSSPLLYCRTAQALQVQTTKPTKLSSSGSFRATISQRFKAGPGSPSIVQVISGHISGHTVHGTIQTIAEPCSGSASFTATAP